MRWLILLLPRRPWLHRLFVLLIGFTSARAADHAPASRGNFELQAGLEMSVFATEPDVVDPVALTFDEWGRVYVVEMRDYPYGIGPDRKPGGTIRLLEDLDGNGLADLSTVFASELSFPTSITPWNGGVLVAAPPEILFLKDTNGDGEADVREVILKGFELGVTDSNLSGLRWGLDNWVHAVNGGNGGSITSPRREGAAPVELGDRDFRFNPATGEIELTTHSGGGFGLVFDEWGRSFTPHNINHIQQRIADADYFTRNPGLPPIRTTHSISDHGDMARIFPISIAQTRPNHPEQAGHFSSAGGMGFIGHRGWPAALQGSVLVCDVVGSLVHRDVLTPNGPILKASRAPGDEAKEFFASRDNSFRPVGLEMGPDGALYLLDMQRDVIEHPDYIPKKMLDKQDIRAGDDRGRIYRILPSDPSVLTRSLQSAGTAHPRYTNREILPGHATPEQLVRLLGSPNAWTRSTAQRLLVARRDQDPPIAALKELARGTDAQQVLARLHALWTLDGLEALDPETLLSALSDPNPRLRANAVTLAKSRLSESAALRARLSALISDGDPEVRFRVALAAGSSAIGNSDFIVYRALCDDASDDWIRRAALGALRRTDWFLPVRLALRPEAKTRPEETVRVLSELYAILAARLRTNDSVVLESAILKVASFPLPQLKQAALEGLGAGLERGRVELHGTPRTQEVLHRMTNSPALLGAAWKLARQLGLPDSAAQKSAVNNALRDAVNPARSIELRRAAIELLELGELKDVAPTLLSLLNATQPATLQQAAYDVLHTHRDPSIAAGLIEAWPSLAPALRAPVVNLLVYRSAFHESLITALEDGRLKVGELNLDLEHRRQLLRHASPEIRSRAAKFTSDEEYSNRNAVVEQWLSRLPKDGNAARGRPVFERICAQCHKAGDLGHHVGPELTGMRHRSVEDLLSNVLDPNMAMEPAYVGYTAVLTDGEEETGILWGENATSVILLQASERKVEIPRGKLRQLKSSSRSLMPEGLEAGLTLQELRDLIAFLQESDAPEPPKPPKRALSSAGAESASR